MTGSRCPRGKKAVRVSRRYVVCRTSHPHNPSKGWRKQAPRRGIERHLLARNCGSACFLEPLTEGYPVCPAYRKRSGKSNCKPSCKGILSAYRRASQYHHSRIANKARRMARKSRCSWI